MRGHRVGFAREAIGGATQEQRPAMVYRSPLIPGETGLKASATLEVQFQAELKLSRVISCGWATVVTAIAGTFTERVYVSKERRRRRLVEPVEQIKAFGD